MSGSPTRARRVVLVVAIACVAAGLVSVGGVILYFSFGANVSGISTSHPLPTPLVKRYLAAIEKGDAATASALDSEAFNSAPQKYVDHRSFLTDSTLGAASERISRVDIELVSANEREAIVDTHFTLGGKRYSPSLFLSWSKPRSSWVLQTTLANTFSVYSYTNITDHTSLPFTLSGTAPVALDTSSPETILGYSAYPAVYALKVDVDAATLADPASSPLSRKFVVRPYDGKLASDATFLLSTGG